MKTRVLIVSSALVVCAGVSGLLMAAEKAPWEVVKEAKGELRAPQRNGNRYEQRSMPKIEFTVGGKAFRVKWTTEPTAERGGAVRMTLYKQVESRGEKVWRRAGAVGNARGKSQGAQAFAGPGAFYVELDGENMRYALTIEEPPAAPAPSK